LKADFYSKLNIEVNKDIVSLMDSDFVLVLGVMPSRDDELFNLLSKNAIVAYLSVIEDKNMSGITAFQSRYEAGSEEGVLAILAKGLLNDKQIDTKTKEFFENLDEGYLSAECNIGEEEIEDLNILYKKSKNPIIVIGHDLYNHPRAKNLANLISLLVRHGNFKIYSQDLDFTCEHNDNLDLENIEDLHSFDGSVIYECPSSDLDEQELLIGSRQFMIASKVKDEQDVFVITESAEHQRKFVMDTELKGTVALMPSAQSEGSYFYKIAKIIKREN